MWTHPRAWLPQPLVDLYDHYRFEYHTFAGRFWAKKRYRFPHLKYLQLGCGGNRFDGYLNTDCFLNREADLNIDARFPLPLESGVWKGIYTHHFVEHLAHDSACAFFCEAVRILEPGGRLRVVVPDGGKLLDLYAQHTAEGDAAVMNYYPKWHQNPLHETPMDVVNHIFRDGKFNAHLFAWDYRTLELRLRQAGFARVMRFNVQESGDPMLAQKDTGDWANHSLYVEAVKGE